MTRCRSARDEGRGGHAQKSILSRLIAGAAAGKPFLDPVKTLGVAHLGQEGTDEWASAVLKFDNEIIAEVSCSVMLKQENVLRIVGTLGPHRSAGFLVRRRQAGRRARPRPARSTSCSMTARPSPTAARRASRSMPMKPMQRPPRSAPASSSSTRPGMSWADTLGNLRTLDKWRADAGLELQHREGTQARRRYHSRRQAQGSRSRAASPSGRSPASASRHRWWRWGSVFSALRRRGDAARPLLREAAAICSTRPGFTAPAASESSSATGCKSRGVKRNSMC